MQSLGIDLSTDPKKVWICELDWGADVPRISALEHATALADPRFPAAGPGDAPPVRDEAGLVAALVDRIARFGPGPERVVGLDAPFGWPVAFVDAVSDWESGDLAGFRKRVELRMRATDRFVQAVTGVTPLSVSVDRVGSTAMLCAEVLSRLARRLDEPRLDRARAVAGLAEVYPPGALRMWTTPDGRALPLGSYKSNPYGRDALLRVLLGLVRPLPGYPGGITGERDLGDRFGRFARYDDLRGYDEGWYDEEDEELEEDWRRPLAAREPFDFGALQLDGLGAAGVAVPAQFRDDLLGHDDAIDAFLCALVARSVAIERSVAIDEPIETTAIFTKPGRSSGSAATLAAAQERAERAREHQLQAATAADAEGWIHLPVAGPMRAALGLPELPVTESSPTPVLGAAPPLGPASGIGAADVPSDALHEVPSGLQVVADPGLAA